MRRRRRWYRHRTGYDRGARGSDGFDGHSRQRTSRVDVDRHNGRRQLSRETGHGVRRTLHAGCSSHIAVLYRYGPDRRAARWQWVSVGSAIAAVTWIAASFLFSWYLASFANYNATYGSLGAVVGLMIWLWISTILVLLGAEFNAEIEHQTARDSTVGDEKPLGVRGAVMADTVGARQT